MELIKNLGTRKIGKNFRRYGLFYCKVCESEVDRRLDIGKKGKTCGCLLHGNSGEKLYKVWTSMKQRCINKNNQRYELYGGRGIEVCNKWGRYPQFRDWALLNGYKYGLTIDRKNNDGGYNPVNCRWVTSETNSQNRSNTKLNWYKVTLIRFLLKHKKMNDAQLSKFFKISLGYVWYVKSNKRWVVK